MSVGTLVSRGRGAPSDQARHVPGEAGVWVLVIGDMVMFAIFFCVFLVARGEDPTTFASSSATLNQDIGALNTLLLLTSSLLVAAGVAALKRGDHPLAARCYAVAGTCTAGFAALKAVEYGAKTSAGITPLTNDFFMHFYVLTGVHLAHLLVGWVLLFFMWKSARRPAGGPREQQFVECGASYWHMVDLLWVVLFTLLYLVPAP